MLSGEVKAHEDTVRTVEARESVMSEYGSRL